MMSSEEGITIISAGADSIDKLEMLWKELHIHHEMIAPHLGVTRPIDESWQRRKSNYHTWLNEPGARLLIAMKDSDPVGYAMIRIVEGSETWVSGNQLTEIETMSILPDFRGEGLGSRMLAAIYSFLRKGGIQEVAVTVVDTNVQAIKFYERRGFVRRYVYMWGDVPDSEE